MKKTIIVFFGFFLLIQTVDAKRLCAWSQNGCVVHVEQSQNGWGMVIGCKDGKGGRWSGHGEWGGVCKGSWVEVAPRVNFR